jgi:hypothetical protein
MSELRKVECKACKKEIMFVPMDSGKMMPVDAKPVQMVILESQAEGKSPRGKMISVLVPHWGTCSDPKRFNKGGGG